MINKFLDQSDYLFMGTIFIDSSGDTVERETNSFCLGGKNYYRLRNADGVRLEECDIFLAKCQSEEYLVVETIKPPDSGLEGELARANFMNYVKEQVRSQKTAAKEIQQNA